MKQKIDNSIHYWFSQEEQEKICSKYHEHIFGHRARKTQDGQPLEGIYDCLLPEKDQQRRVYMRGGCVFLVDRMTVDHTTRPQPEWAKFPWGTFPDLPK